MTRARTNVRLDWKVIANYKHSSLLDLVISDEGKKFYNIDTKRRNILKCDSYDSIPKNFISILMLHLNRYFCAQNAIFK
jgi:hypothetical protein